MAKIDLGNVMGDVNPDTLIPYDTPDEYTEPASGDAIKTFFGKVTRGLRNLIDGKIDKASIADNFATTDNTMVAAATTVKTLKEGQDEINENLETQTATTAGGTLSGITTTTLSIKKKNGRVTINGLLTYNSGFPVVSTKILTINESDFCPDTTISAPCETSTSSHATMSVGLITVSSTGDVTLIQKLSGAVQLSFSFSYDV